MEPEQEKYSISLKCFVPESRKGPKRASLRKTPVAELQQFEQQRTVLDYTQNKVNSHPCVGE